MKNDNVRNDKVEKLREVENLIESLLPCMEWERQGNIMMPTSGVFELEICLDETTNEYFISFGISTWDDFPIYKLRIYVEYILATVGGFLDYWMYPYDGDWPPGCRGGGRGDFCFADIFVHIK